MEKPILKPHLPKQQVKSVLYGARYRVLLAPALEKLHIRSLTVEDYPYVSQSVAGHIDLCCCHFAEKELFVAESVLNQYAEIINSLKYVISTGSDVVVPKYPYEAAYNAAVIGENVFCNPKTIHQKLLEKLINLKLKLISCRQGYTKCSVAVVDEDAIISSDEDLCRNAKKAGFDCLQIKPGYISLPGYNTGFIGGCTVKLNKDVIAFTGTLCDHPDKSSIEAFIKSRGYQILYLTDHPIFDIGSMIPLTEER